MFEALAEKFDSLLRKLQGQGRITERNIEDALRDVRLALLEADVNLQVVRDFVEAVKRDALGQEVLRSLTPEQHFLRLVHRELVRLLGEGPGGLDLGGAAPAVILLVGLNGSGKTTTAAKLARHLRAERSRTPYLVAADLYRPAAIEQLETLARQLDLPVHPARAGDDPVALARAAIEAARASGRDTVLIDTAGRQTVDETLMLELERMVTAVTPRHVLLVADAMTGQDAVATAQGFAGRLPVSGIVLTRWRATHAAAPPCPCGPWRASRSSSLARARSSTRSSPSMRIASPLASSAWGTSFRSSSVRSEPTIATRHRPSRRSSASRSSTSRTFGTSSAR